MASINNIKAGLDLLSHYVRPDDLEGVRAEHDIIYVGDGDTNLPHEHAEHLGNLGWHFEEDVGWALYV